MASKTICSVPPGWTLDDHARHTCFDGSHSHLSFAEINKREKTDVVCWLRRAASRAEKSVVQIHLLERRDDSWAGRQLSTYSMPGEPMNKGLSFRLGPYLAKHVRQNHSWAVVMFSQINRPRAQRESAILEEGALECLPS
jgi:hypothetical protein